MWELHSVVRQIGPVSETPVALVGVEKDNTPVFIDLATSQAGSLLFYGKKGLGKTTALRSFLASAALLNQPDTVQLFVLARKPEEYEDLGEEFIGQFGGVYSLRTGSKTVVETLHNILTALRNGGEIDNRVVLAIDGLESVPGQHHQQVKELVEFGSEYGIWVIGASEQKDLAAFPFKTVFKAVGVGQFIFRTGGQAYLMSTVPYEAAEPALLKMAE